MNKEERKRLDGIKDSLVSYPALFITNAKTAWLVEMVERLAALDMPDMNSAAGNIHTLESAILDEREACARVAQQRRQTHENATHNLGHLVDTRYEQGGWAA